MDILWILFEISLNFFDEAFLLLIMTFQLGRKPTTQTKHLFLYYLGFVFIATAFNRLTMNSVAITFVILSLVFLYSVLFLQGGIIYKVFWSIFPFTIMFGSDILAVSIITKISPGISYVEISSVNPNIYRFQGAILTKTIELILLFLFLRVRLNLERYNKLGFALSTTCITFMLILMTLTYITGHVDTISTTIYFSIAVAFFVSQMIYFFILYVQSQEYEKMQQVALAEQEKRHRELLTRQEEMHREMLAQQEKAHQEAVAELLRKQQEVWGEQEKLHKEAIAELNNKLATQQSELKLKTYKELQASHEKFARYQGAVNECLQKIWSIAKKRKIFEVDEILQTFSEINMQFMAFNLLGNTFLEVILAGKEVTASKEGIRMRYNVELPEEGQFDLVDISIIAIHLLDNAIEALVNGDIIDLFRNIEFSMKPYEGYYFIVSTNMTDTLQRSSRELDALMAYDYPGFGLKIIREIVNRYNGEMKFQHEDYYFSLSIRLPLPSA